MAQEEAIKLFEGLKIRVIWDDEKEKYFFSVVDIIQVLTESTTPRRYWSDLKRKLEAEGSEVYEKIVQLKLQSPDGKQRLTDVADAEIRDRNALRGVSVVYVSQKWPKIKEKV